MARTIVAKKSGRAATETLVTSAVGEAGSTAARPRKRTAVQVVAPALPAAMTGRASPAKARDEDGDGPVFAYIRSLPQPQRGIAERVDALAARTLPGLRRSVKWGIAWYGDGWCFCCGGFAGHVKLTFGRGTSLKPVPPAVPVGMGKDSRGVDLESLDALDERQAASWMKQAAAMPGFGKRR